MVLSLSHTERRRERHGERDTESQTETRTDREGQTQRETQRQRERQRQSVGSLCIVVEGEWHSLRDQGGPKRIEIK